MVERRYETRDATLRPLVLFLGGLALLCALVFVAMVGLFELFERTVEEAQDPSGAVSPLATRRVIPQAPLLQIDEVADLESFRRAERERSETYGWIDRSAGVVRIPIERAAELVLERGLPTRESGGRP